MLLPNRHGLWCRLTFMAVAAGLFPAVQRLIDCFAPGGSLVALFTRDTDRARTAADLRVLHDHLDLLLPEGR